MLLRPWRVLVPKYFQSMAATHAWTFKSRLRSRAFGWKGSHLACPRLKEAVTEIKKVARIDPVTAGDGVVSLMERIWRPSKTLTPRPVLSEARCTGRRTNCCPSRSRLPQTERLATSGWTASGKQSRTTASILSTKGAAPNGLERAYTPWSRCACRHPRELLRRPPRHSGGNRRAASRTAGRRRIPTEDELEAPLRELVVSGRRQMAARADRGRTRSQDYFDAPLVGTETGVLIDKTSETMAAVQDRGQFHGGETSTINRRQTQAHDFDKP
jgi:hypothetical protein